MNLVLHKWKKVSHLNFIFVKSTGVNKISCCKAIGSQLIKAEVDTIDGICSRLILPLHLACYYCFDHCLIGPKLKAQSSKRGAIRFLTYSSASSSGFKTALGFRFIGISPASLPCIVLTRLGAC